MTGHEIRVKALELAVEYANAINKGSGWDRIKPSDIERILTKI